MSRLWCYSLGFTGLVLICFYSIGAFAAAPGDQAAKQLAGTRAREWVYKRFETFMGAGNKCKQGESYRFAVDQRVTIETCVDGEVHTQIKRWSIDASDPLDVLLAIGDTSYVLLFQDSAQGHFMILRTKPKTKLEPVVDKNFRLAEE